MALAKVKAKMVSAMHYTAEDLSHCVYGKPPTGVFDSDMATFDRQRFFFFFSKWSPTINKAVGKALFWRLKSGIIVNEMLMPLPDMI